MKDSILSFQQALLPYYDAKRRDLPWRHLSSNDAERFYQVLVSEFMLQQTQVSRVIEKYLSWLTRFPNMNTLAKASFLEVLGEWAGLGYSRRAKYLHDCAQSFSNSKLPDSVEELTHFKGIGPNTAGAVLAYYKNIPTAFIETNIRTVLFHHFYQGKTDISDSDLSLLVKKLVDANNPRAWYWAMMDYGSDLKKSLRNISMSKHYKKQSVFEGSNRQLRSRLLKYLLSGSCTTMEALSRVEKKQFIIDSLVKDGLIVCKLGYVSLS